MNTGTKKITTYALLIATAFVLSYVEGMLPAFFAIPGMKLGLTNIVVLYALYETGPADALIINVIRIILAGICFGTPVSFAFSIAGGVFSFLVMLLMKKSGKFRLISVSIAGGVIHNSAQILVAVVLLNTTQIAWYFVLLYFAGIAAGAVIGAICAVVIKRLAAYRF